MSMHLISIIGRYSLFKSYKISMSQIFYVDM